MSKKIYVVEDEMSIRRILEIKMKSAGYDAIGFGDATSALEAFRTERPDLIVADYRMPGEMNGAELILAVRRIESGSDVPIILLSGSIAVMDELRVALAEIKNVIYMSKPFSPRALVAEIDKIFVTCP